MPAVKTYTKVNFQNYPSTSTPLNATNLNKMDKGIDDLDDLLVTARNNIETLQSNATADEANILALQGEISEINDNLAQTPITVGGETLSTIDDKLNYLCETSFNLISKQVVSVGGSSDAVLSYTATENEILMVISEAICTYSTTAETLTHTYSFNTTGTIVDEYNTTLEALSGSTRNRVKYQHIRIVKLEAGDTITSSIDCTARNMNWNLHQVFKIS